MTPQSLFVATVAVCLANGLVSPALRLVWVLHPLWMPPLFPITPELVFYGASLIVSTATLLLAAIPAAMAERVFGASQTAVMGVWLAVASLLVLLGLR